MKIKICGITNQDDALNAVSLGADAIGFIFSQKSPRYITPEQAEAVAMFLPPFVSVVGVFVNASADEIEAAISRCKLDIIQLHGNETPNFCRSIPRRVIKAFPIATPEDLEIIAQYQGFVSSILLDTKVQNMEGGTGKIFDWGLAIKAKSYEIPLILAGGINAQNIKKAKQLVNPYAVDLSSSVESSPGKKDYNKMKEIIDLAKGL
jgi:phosphoribosylanthranilate isomerase